MRARPGEAAATFEQLVTRNTDDCTLWPFSVNSRGYGQLGVNGVSTSVHVLACERAHGPRPEGMQVAHSCGVRRCLNPRHVRWATPAENEADKVAHGTAGVGVSNGNAKLTESQVRVIRAAAAGGARQVDLAEVFGISTHHVADIRDGRYWAHVPDEPGEAA